jgi:hypothetical protein
MTASAGMSCELLLILELCPSKCDPGIGLVDLKKVYGVEDDAMHYLFSVHRNPAFTAFESHHGQGLSCIILSIVQ